MSAPLIGEAELNGMLIRAGLTLTPDQVSAILPGAVIFRQMIARVNAPLPREAEPALTFISPRDGRTRPRGCQGCCSS